jgi:hypothetical protein
MTFQVYSKLTKRPPLGMVMKAYWQNRSAAAGFAVLRFFSAIYLTIWALNLDSLGSNPATAAEVLSDDIKKRTQGPFRTFVREPRAHASCACFEKQIQVQTQVDLVEVCLSAK